MKTTVRKSVVAIENTASSEYHYDNGGYEYMEYPNCYHRVDGPAIAFKTSNKNEPYVKWFIFGKDITEDMEEHRAAISGDPFNVTTDDKFFYATMIDNIIKRKGRY